MLWYLGHTFEHPRQATLYCTSRQVPSFCHRIHSIVLPILDPILCHVKQMHHVQGKGVLILQVLEAIFRFALATQRNVGLDENYSCQTTYRERSF